MKGLGLLVFGVGLGALGGTPAGRPVAIGAVAVGLVLIAIGGRPRAGSLIEDAKDSRETGSIGDARAPSARPTLAGLGTRVEDILRLAEEQAADHRAAAEREAAAIIAAARAEAQRIHPD
jgi:hypothetical protein